MMKKKATSAKSSAPKKSTPSKTKSSKKAKPATIDAASSKIGTSKKGGSSASKASSAVGGTKEHPWTLNTPSGQSEYLAYREEGSDPPALVVLVGKTELRYHLRCLDDLLEMLKKHGDWMLLGSADEQKPAKEGTIEAWARDSKNPVGGWYGLKKGLRGRFANYVPPVLKHLGLVEVEEKPRDNRMRAIP